MRLGRYSAHRNNVLKRVSGSHWRHGVIPQHAWPLTGREFTLQSTSSSPRYGSTGAFVISRFLITASWLRDPNLRICSSPDQCANPGRFGRRPAVS